jgi:hypothetical protein
MARRIDHQPAPGEARRVGDGQRRHRDRLAEGGVGAEQLRQRHRAMDEAAVARGGDGDALRRHRKPIGLVAGNRGVADEADRAGRTGNEGEAAFGLDVGGEQAGRGGGAGIRGGDPRAVADGEAACGARDRLGQGKQRQRVLRRCGGGREQGERRSPDDGRDTGVLRHDSPLVLFWY